MRRARGEDHLTLALDPTRYVRPPVDIFGPDGGFAIEKNLADRDLGDKVVIRSPLNDPVVVSQS